MFAEELPKHWKDVRLEEITNIIAGQSPKGETYNTHGIGAPLINGPAEFGSEFPTPVQWTIKPTKLCEISDILFCVRGNTTGRMNIADQRYCIGRGIAAIRGRSHKSDTSFIRNLLEQNLSSLYRIATGGGSTFPNLSAAQLKNYPIRLPPLPEQHAIAHVLQTIQDAKFARQEEIVLERERKAALMDFLFSHGTKNEPRKQTEIGEIPESWEQVRLGEVTEIIMGQSPKGDTYNTDGEGEPLINGPAEFGSAFPTPVQWTIKPTKVCKDGDILFCVRGNTTGRMNIADQRYCIGRGIAAIREKIQLSNALFIKNLLEHEHLSLYRIAIGGGSTFPNISTVQLKNYAISLPTVSEQVEIAEILNACDTKIAALEQEAERLDELFHAMLDELMTGKRSAVPLIDSELP